MWLYTNDGCLSVVAVHENPRKLEVRAPQRDHLVRFMRRSGLAACAQITEEPGAAFCWCVVLQREDVGVALVNAIAAVDYECFTPEKGAPLPGGHAPPLPHEVGIAPGRGLPDDQPTTRR